MKKKVEYFFNAVYYTRWNWIAKRQISSIKGFNFIILKIISVICTDNCRMRFEERQRKRISELEEYINCIPNGIVSFQAECSLNLILFMYGFSIYFPFFVIVTNYIHDKHISDIITFSGIVLTIGLIIRIYYIIENNYLKYFKKFRKKDEAWHKKWKRITLFVNLLPIILFILYFMYVYLCCRHN